MHPLLVFLIVMLVLAVVIYVVKIILDQLELDPPIRKIALLILGVIAIIILVAAALNVFGVNTGFNLGQRQY